MWMSPNQIDVQRLRPNVVSIQSQCLASVGPSETRPGTMDFIFVIRFNEGKNRLLTTPFEVLDDDPGIIADSLIETRFCNVVRNRTHIKINNS